METNIFNKLKERGYIYQSTHEDEIKKLIDGKPITFYLGIDPTADSLHIGHFFALMMFRQLQEAGHRGILVIGGATALVGDPTGKSDLRKMLNKEDVIKNIEEVKKIAEKFVLLDGENPAVILDNSDWINNYSYVDFMREIGVHFNVNKMLSADTYANRLKEGGLTFLEMGYMLMQAYDFVYLNKKYECILQIGGSDQWGNIVAGVNLGRKLNYIDDSDRDLMFGLTCPLLMTKDGKKMGKTEKGALWIAREKTTVFDFYQYFYNVDDKDVEMLLKLFTRISNEKIKELLSENILIAKKTMAYEITRLVHGQEEADKVVSSVNALFGNGENTDNAPSCKIEKQFIEKGISIIDFLVITKFLPSKSEARRMIQHGGIMINGVKIENLDYVVKTTDIVKDYILLKKGKKTFLKVSLK